MKARIPNSGMNRNDMLKQVQKMQDDMASLQTELEETEYSAEAGGMVEATVNGKHELKMIKIKPEAVDPDDVEMLEDLIMAAVNSAVGKAAADSEARMQAVTGGMNIPGLF